VAAQSVPAPELKALHERISRDVAEMRRRTRRWTGEGRNSPDDVLKVVVEAFRILRALRGLAPGAGLALLIVAGAAAGFRARRGRR